jgi:selenocysteine-specific elongation factor
MSSSVRVVATAGHVDHGKSTLVRALTGIDPDRWDEEKRRGLTIDLGFASCTLPSGAAVAFVDVPGHVRFLKNMLAGVGAVDACLLAVAATEGWKPQSEEHLRILELLGVAHGVVALTKVGAVGSERAAAGGAEVAERLAGSTLAAAEVVCVDAPAGVGVDDLRHALDRLVAAMPPAESRGRPRLWVDRSFTVRGAGTVVTGTLAGGHLAVGDAVEVAGRAARVRGLQTFGRPVETAAPGTRVAANLAGVGHREVRRGDAVVRPGEWHLATTVDATLRVLGTVGHDVSRRGAWLAYLGSGEHGVRLRVLGDRPVAPGGEGLVRLHLPVALPLRPGDRYVLRDAGRQETVGGGELLDVAPVLPAARAEPDRDPRRVVRERGWVEATEAARLLGGDPRPAGEAIGRWIVDPAEVARLARSLAARVEAAGPLGLDVATLDERERAVLARTPGVVVTGGRARAETAPGEDLACHPYVAALRGAPFAPPSPAEAGVAPGELRELVRRRLVVERDGCHFAPTAVDAAARVVASLLAARPGGVTAGEVRDALGTTRKYAIPLLGLLDAAGVTRRRGAVRIGGPRLPAPDADAGHRPREG